MTEPTHPQSIAVTTVDVLAFGAHPDDVELCCGGLIAKLVALGHRVAIVDLTRGEMSSRGTVEERAAEAARAAQLLGVAHRGNLALPDGGLRRDDDEQAASIASTLRALRPELVVAPWSIERHPDHEAAHALVRRAVFLAGLQKWTGAQEARGQAAQTQAAQTQAAQTQAAKAHRPRTVLWYPMRHLAEPSFIVDVSAHFAAKLAAIRCHASQLPSAMATATATATATAPATARATAAPPSDVPVPTLIGSALSLSSLEARDAFYGAQIGAAHGEPYLIDEAVHIDDPVVHFRGRPPALFFSARARGSS